MNGSGPEYDTVTTSPASPFPITAAWAHSRLAMYKPLLPSELDGVGRPATTSVARRT